MQVAPVEVSAICDVDRHMLEEAGQLIQDRSDSNSSPRMYEDFREMLSRHELDIVIIGTPDHWHALNMIEAVKSGAHVYVQKPTSVGVLESETMLAAARKYDRVVQLGTQRRSTPHLIRSEEHTYELQSR